MSAAVEKFAEKAKTIGLSVHLDKTKVVIIVWNMKSNIDMKVRLNGQDIKKVKEQRLVGFMVNKKLDFSGVDIQISKALRRLWFLTKAK